MNRLVAPLLLLFSLVACGMGDLSLVIRYDRTDGLAAGAPVLLERAQIGSVREISFSTAGTYEVKVGIDRAHAKSLTEHARFVIVDDPAKAGAKAIAVSIAEAGGTPLANGAVVDGSTPVAAMVDSFGAGLKQGIEELGSQVEAVQRQVEELAKSDEVKRLEEEVRNLANAMQRSGEEARKRLENQVLPMLRHEAEQLREKLKELGREGEMAPIDQQLEEMTRI